MTAERLSEAMNDRNIDQSALARAVGVTQGTISLILLGKTRRSKHLPDLARYLGVSLPWLMGHPGETKSHDRPEKVVLRPGEVDLIERYRQLGSIGEQIVDTIVDALLLKRAVDESALTVSPDEGMRLPAERPLTAMFEAMLAGIKPSLPEGDKARLLAQRLPIALAQLQDLRPGSDTEAPEATGVDQTTLHPESTR